MGPLKLPEAFTAQVLEDRENLVASPSTKMAVALGFKDHVYAGTVPAHEKARRRAANRAARKARRASR